MTQLLFFDLDDTLLDHAHAEQAAQRETFETHAGVFDGVAFDSWLERYREANGALWNAYGRGEVVRHDLHQQRFSTPLTHFGLDSAHATALGAHYLAAYRRHWRLNPGAEEILEAAAQQGIVGIVSNGFVETQRAKVERFRLGRWVKHLVLSEDVGVMKPDRAIFDAAVRVSGVSKGRKIYVGDSFDKDIVGAKAAGWLPILYNPLRLPIPAPVLFVTRLVDLGPLLE
ncbi:MAG: HAD-IA family hydrolase [Thermoanaerobaculia bacterium]